jgi:hypothetical protein
MTFSGMLSEDSLRISPPFPKGQKAPRPLPKGVGGDLTIGKRKPQTSPPLPKGAGGI